jgi:flagellar biosynthesis protein FlhF
MNLKRFTARTSREALALVRQAFGDDAVVMSTRPCAEGVEVLAMAPESLQQIERLGARAPAVSAAAPSAPAAAPAGLALRPAREPSPAQPARTEPRWEAESAPARGPLQDEVAQDVAQLQMSTLSFQDYVRERMLRRRQAELQEQAQSAPVPPPTASPIEAVRARHAARQGHGPHDPRAGRSGLAEPPVLREEIEVSAPRRAAGPVAPVEPPAAPRRPPPAALRAAAAEPAEQAAMLSELRSMRGLIEQRFSALAFMEKLQRQPRQAALAQRLLDGGFSPALIRRLVQSLPAEVDETEWATGVLEENLITGEREPALEDAGGVFAVIGATGVGKTTSTAKLAAAFAARHGAAQLGLVTLDAYRVAAHEQLRAYGRILGVPVHTAHDRSSLEDLLDLLAAKRMVIIDTAGMAQRDSRTRELLEMLSHRNIQKLLVINASAQGETIEDQIAAYAAATCRGVILSKLDEAVKLGPALDAMIRHSLRVLAVANGQRVPEDWHRLGAAALIQRAMKSAAMPAWCVDECDVNLIFAGLPAAAGGLPLNA